MFNTIYSNITQAIHWVLSPFQTRSESEKKVDAVGKNAFSEPLQASDPSIKKRVDRKMGRSTLWNRVKTTWSRFFGKSNVAIPTNTLEAKGLPRKETSKDVGPPDGKLARTAESQVVSGPREVQDKGIGPVKGSNFSIKTTREDTKFFMGFSIVQKGLDEKEVFTKMKQLLSELEKKGLEIVYDDDALKIEFKNGKMEILAAVESTTNVELYKLFFVGGGRSIFNGYMGSYMGARLYIDSKIDSTDFLEEINEFFSSYIGEPQDWSAPLSRCTLDTPSDIVQLFQNGTIPGICIGEGHSDPMPKKFLIEQMQSLRDSGVTTLFLEHLFYDTSSQTLLDEWYKKGGEMPLLIKHRLNQMDKGYLIRGEYNFTALVQSAFDAGVRVVGIDTATSYECGHSDRDGVTDTTLRMKAMNSVAQEIISREKGTGAFVVLIGNLHATTTDEIPGVPELTGTPSLFIHSAENDEKPGITRDYRETVKKQKVEHLLAFDLALAM